MPIRPAVIDDHEALCAIDSVAATSMQRRDQIRDWLGSACCLVAEEGGRVAAYGVLTNHFFGQPFVEMLMVGQEFRRQGLGASILGHFQSMAREQFQEKCVAVFRPELRENKELERFRVSVKNGNAPGLKLFSSTNMSNTPMQMLFARTGFKPSGYVDNLDEGDPEIIFCYVAA